MRKKIFTLFFIAVSMLLGLQARAQDEVTGQVTDGENKALPGVSVVIKGTNNGSSTDIEGNYSINAQEGDVLVFTFLGFVPVEKAVGANKTVNAQLSQDVARLNQVVVTGYSTQRKKDLTGAVTVVNIEQMTQQPTSQVTAQLQGQASGVTILGGGQPGDDLQIRIRGINTFGNNSPLFVVDGVPTQNINTLNPNDVASMQVLKDAGSASIYGSRAANGVVIITTKKGKGKVQVRYDAYYGTQRVQQGNVWDILSSQGMADLRWMALKNTNPSAVIDDPQYGDGAEPVLPDYIAPEGLFEGDPGTDPAMYNVDPMYTNPAAINSFYRIVKANKQGTDWFHEIFSPAPISSHNVSVSGGGEQGNYLFSMNYFNQQGTLFNTYNKRYTIRANTQYNVSDNVRIGENLAFSLIDNPRIGELTEGSAIGHALREQPIIPVRDIMGNYAGSFGQGLGNALNPVALQDRLRLNGGLGRRLFGNVYAEIDIVDNLTARTSFGGELWSGSGHSFAFPQYENAENATVNSYSENASNGYNWTWTNTVQYKKVFGGKHDFSFLAGTEAYQNKGRNVGGTTLSFFSFDPDYVNLSTGSGTKTNFSGEWADALFSVFGSVDYIYNEKYLIGATLRYDGSSRFLNTQYGWFPSVSAGWRISEESFMEDVTWVNSLKIRGSYGIMGNQLNVDVANAFTTYGSDRLRSYYDITGSSSSITEGFQKTRIGNPDAVWEKNINSNIGVDASLFKGRMSITADYYRKEIKDLLFNPALIGTAGQATQPFVNIAEMKNSGLDMSIGTYFDLTSDLQMDATLTFTSYDNEILKISNSSDYFDQDGRRFNGSSIVRNAVGQSISQFFGYQTNGFWDTQDEIDAANAEAQAATGDAAATYQDESLLGHFRYADVNNDGRITPDDRTFLGNPNPDFSYGLNLGLRYKGFDFSIFFYGVSGNDIWNNVKWFTDFYSSFLGAKSNTALYDSWTPTNHSATAPIQKTTGSFSLANVPNSYFVEKGSYLRAKNAQLGYTLPTNTVKKIGVERLRIYVQAANLFTISNYSGLDPEISGDITSFGIDEGAYPNQRQFLMGVNLTF